MRAAKVQARQSRLRQKARQKARSLAPLNGWACAVTICHDGMLEDTNSLDAAQLIISKEITELKRIWDRQRFQVAVSTLRRFNVTLQSANISHSI